MDKSGVPWRVVVRLLGLVGSQKDKEEQAANLRRIRTALRAGGLQELLKLLGAGGGGGTGRRKRREKVGKV